MDGWKRPVNKIKRQKEKPGGREGSFPRRERGQGGIHLGGGERAFPRDVWGEKDVQDVFAVMFLFISFLPCFRAALLSFHNYDHVLAVVYLAVSSPHVLSFPLFSSCLLSFAGESCNVLGDSLPDLSSCLSRKLEALIMPFIVVIEKRSLVRNEMVQYLNYFVVASILYLK